MTSGTLPEAASADHLQPTASPIAAPPPTSPTPSTMETTAVYSVWALPPPEITSRLKTLMSTLRTEFPTPAFDPHITLVGAIRLPLSDALRHLHDSASALSPFTVRVAAVSRGTFFYQCVFLLIDPTPEVANTSAHCCRHFGYKTDTPYMPHLSLLYGDLTEEEKEKARERAEALGEGICGLSFEVNEIALYKTDTEDKSLESWGRIAVCSLQK